MNSRGMLKGSGVTAILIAALFAPFLLSDNRYWLSILTILAVNVLLVSSLRTITLLNVMSLGQVGFALIGAYGSALLMMKAGVPFWLAVILSGLMSALVALVLGYPFMKVKGIYFAILTLLTAETLRLIAYYWASLTGGTYGLLGIPSPGSLTLPVIGAIDFTDPGNYFRMTVLVLAACLGILYLIEHSHISFKWRAIRDAEELAQSVGINVIWYRIVNFVIACFFAGISGSLFAHYQHGLSADYTSRFGALSSIYLVVYLIVGGQQSFAGPLIGTAALTLLSEATRPFKEYQPIIIGAIAILVILFMPGALASLPGQVRSRLRRKGRKGESGRPRATARMGASGRGSAPVGNLRGEGQ